MWVYWRSHISHGGITTPWRWKILRGHEKDLFWLFTGDSAFEFVNRTIQTRELYCAGETGQYWQSSHFSYQNSLTRIKMDGKLSRNIEENLGVKQGRDKSSDHYKSYIAPLLDTTDNSCLGVWIGNINVWSCRWCSPDVWQADQTTSTDRNCLSLWQNVKNQIWSLQNYQK